jgi:lipopolysaccharide transport system permease protein
VTANKILESLENTSAENWDLTIKARRSLFDVNLKAIWRYRYLLRLFVRRDFVATYKQTIIGPLWFILQPVLTTITYFVIFSNIAQIPTDGIPPILFYMSGVVLWNYFSECLVKTSDTFVSNAAIFGKVYFPRLLVPLSVVVSNLIRLGIQLALFLACWTFYAVRDGNLHISGTIALLPLLLLLMAGHGLALGIIISSLTTKYRDLKFLIAFGVQLLMYASPIVYPLSTVSPENRWILQLNPMTSIIETFKYSVLGKGIYQPEYLVYNLLLMIVLLFAGVIIFNKVEKSFMDTV